MNEGTNAAGVYVSFPFATRDVLGHIAASKHINYSHLEPILPQDTVDRLEQDCLNIVKVQKTQHFDCCTLCQEEETP